MNGGRKNRDLNEEDAALFREMTKGVRPLNPQNRADLSKQQPSPQTATAQSGDTENAPTPWYRDGTMAEPPSPVEAEEALFYVRDHLPHATLRRLKRGEFCSNLELDLHGFTTTEASEMTDQLIRQALHRQLRCFRLIHGKGRRSSDQTPVLKSHINQWLRQQPEVLAFCSARQKDGGTGALYVLLKRSS